MQAAPIKAVFLVGLTLAASCLSAQTTSSDGKVTISKETTYIEAPLRPDGYVDYMELLNRQCSKGVTPENNAAVPLCQAIGPKEIPEELRTEYYRRLGINPLPEDGSYLIAYSDYLKRVWKNKHSDQGKTPSPEWSRCSTTN